MSIYNATSSYATTQTRDYFLDVMNNRSIPRYEDDIVFVINETYDERPDLLAYDLYNHADLWWVFAQRNPNTLVNPLRDFKAGTAIFLPKVDTLQDVLGF